MSKGFSILHVQTLTYVMSVSGTFIHNDQHVTVENTQAGKEMKVVSLRNPRTRCLRVKYTEALTDMSF